MDLSLMQEVKGLKQSGRVTWIDRIEEGSVASSDRTVESIAYYFQRYEEKIYSVFT